MLILVFVTRQLATQRIEGSVRVAFMLRTPIQLQVCGRFATCYASDGREAKIVD